MNENSSDFGSCFSQKKNVTESWLDELRFWTEIVLLIILNLLVVIGNIFVLVALMIDRQLRNPTHYIICSLAVADLTLGIFVLPFAAVFQMRGVWIFGSLFCQIWLGVDVWLCTASIYSLIAVTLDRYIAVTKPLTYKSVMTHRRACALIAAVWTLSLIICLPAIASSFGRTYHLASTTCQCTQMGHSASYIAYSSTGSFYLPMIIILYLYAEIYATVRRIRLSGNSGVVLTGSQRRKYRPPSARKISKGLEKATKKEHISLLEKGRQLSAVLRVHKGGYHPARKLSPSRPIMARLSASFRCARTPRPAVEASAIWNSESRRDSETGNVNFLLSPSTNKRFLANSCPASRAPSRRSSLTSERRNSGSSLHDLLLNIAVPAQLTTMWGQRMMALQKCQKKVTSELRALKTVGIVTGCFFLSWLGFCVVYTMQAFPSCRPAKSFLTWDTKDALRPVVSAGPSYSSIDSCVPDWIVNLMVWLGYVNSAMNPLIYGIANQQFRRAFRRIAFFKFCDSTLE